MHFEMRKLFWQFLKGISLKMPISLLLFLREVGFLALLIIVSYACYGVGVLFSSRRTFFSMRTQKRLLWAISIKRIRQPKHQLRHVSPPDHLLEWICEFNSIILFYAVLSWGNVVNLRTFWRTSSRPTNGVGVQKMTNMRYAYSFQQVIRRRNMA